MKKKDLSTGMRVLVAQTGSNGEVFEETYIVLQGEFDLKYYEGVHEFILASDNGFMLMEDSKVDDDFNMIDKDSSIKILKIYESPSMVNPSKMLDSRILGDLIWSKN